MFKVAIVGCGKIAYAHASQIQRIKGCEIVGVCSRDPLKAQQFCERFPIKRYFADLTELVSEARPAVFHITTPPESHFDIARFCLEQGCHIYVEKPFTLYAEQAQLLIDVANRKRVKLTVGHNDQFSHVARRMRALVQSGYLGGLPCIWKVITRTILAIPFMREPCSVTKTIGSEDYRESSSKT